MVKMTFHRSLVRFILLYIKHIHGALVQVVRRSRVIVITDDKEQANIGNITSNIIQQLNPPYVFSELQDKPS